MQRQEILNKAFRVGRIPFGFAVVLSVYALTGGRSAAQAMGLSPLVVVAAYVGLAVLVTVLILLFGTWATSRGRAAALGYLAAALLSLVLYLTVMRATDLGVLTPLQLIASMLTFGLLGAWAGFLFWEPR